MNRDGATTLLGYLAGFALLFLVWHLAAVLLEIGRAHV